MISVVDATGKGIVIDCSSPSLKPGEQTSSDIGRNLELHGSSGLLLNDHRASSNFLARNESPYSHFYEIVARSFLSMARPKSARSLIPPSRSRKKRTAQSWRCFKGFLTPTCWPAFQARRPSALGSYCEIPIAVLLWPPLATGRTRTFRSDDGARSGPSGPTSQAR